MPRRVKRGVLGLDAAKGSFYFQFALVFLITFWFLFFVFGSRDVAWRIPSCAEFAYWGPGGAAVRDINLQELYLGAKNPGNMRGRKKLGQDDRWAAIRQKTSENVEAVPSHGRSVPHFGLLGDAHTAGAVASQHCWLGFWTSQLRCCHRPVGEPTPKSCRTAADG